MKYIVILLVMFTSLLLNAQSSYDKGMQKGFEFWGKGENSKAIATFERIAQAEKTNWVPYYYAAQIGILSSFGEKDKTKQDLLLNNASAIIDNAMLISPDNSELYSLKGLLLTAFVASDPMVNGAKLSGKTIMTYEKSIQLDSTNPRPYYLKAQFGMGAARFFKQDLTPYCLEIENALVKFDSFEVKGKYFPTWGKDQAIEILKSSDCVSKEEKKSE